MGRRNAPRPQTCRRTADIRTRLERRCADARALLGRHQPLDRRGLYSSFRQAGPRHGREDRAGPARRGTTCVSESSPDRSRRQGTRARRPHDRSRPRHGPRRHRGRRFLRGIAAHPRRTMSGADLKNVVRIGLSAAIVSVANEQPSVLVVHHRDAPDALPFGPFDPLKHRTLESGLRSWVSEQTYLELGYAEQLYTFGDRGRHMLKAGEGPRLVSVGYLALTRGGTIPKAPGTEWRDWYGFFPWEDWRAEKPAIIDAAIAPALKTFADNAATPALRDKRRERTRVAFGLGGTGWDEEKTLERYEIL